MGTLNCIRSLQIPVFLWEFPCFDEIFCIFIWNPISLVQFLILLNFFLSEAVSLAGFHIKQSRRGVH